MSESITIEDIYQLFEKTNQKFEQSQREWEKSRSLFDVGNAICFIKDHCGGLRLIVS